MYVCGRGGYACPFALQVFATISPDDAKNGIVIRLSQRSYSNQTFPATDTFVDEFTEERSFLNALQQGASTFLELRLDDANLVRYVTENPIGAAEMFKNILRELFSIFFGMEYSNASTKTTNMFSKHRGAFGTSIAAFGVTETQGKAS